MCLVNKHTLIQREELPKFNGRSVKSIYAVYENSRYAPEGYIADILYYKVNVHGTWEERYKNVHMKVKDLPADFHFMGRMVENKGRRIFVKDLWFRERDSANGSFTDESFDISGWETNATNGSFNIYRAEPYMGKPENKWVVDCKSDLGKAMLNILSKDYEVTEVEFYQCGSKAKEGTLDFASTYPYAHTPIQISDGLVYRDEKLPSWRWLHGMPYMLPTDVDPKDRSNIRVWDADLKQHVFLQRADDLAVGDESLVQVSFTYKQHDLYGNEGSAYCRIARYNASCGHEYVRYEVEKMTKEGVKCKVSNSKSGKRSETLWHNSLYRVMRIRESNEIFPEKD